MATSHKMPAPGILHTYAPGLVAFEHLPTNRPSALTDHKLVFVGGLGDGLFTVPYVQHLLTIAGWGIIELILTSSYKGWGVSSVIHDASEIASAITHLRRERPGVKFVLLGHSTGSQDTLQYLLDSAAGKAPMLDAAILQASVSDREFIVKNTSKTSYLTSLNFAESWIRDGRGAEIIPAEMRPGFEDTPVCAERWYSLAAPLDASGCPKGKEDFFSSDLADAALEVTFGRLPRETPLCVLYSERDQFVPEFVDKEGLVRRWGKVVSGKGGRFHGVVVKGADHSLEGAGEEVMEGFVAEVREFLRTFAAEAAVVKVGGEAGEKVEVKDGGVNVEVKDGGVNVEVKDGGVNVVKDGGVNVNMKDGGVKVEVKDGGVKEAEVKDGKA